MGGRKGGEAQFPGLARADIDTAIANAYTMRSFWGELVKGYQVKRYPQVTHAAVKPPGGARFLRLDKLGAGYSEAEIFSRLTESRIGTAPPISDHTPILPQRYFPLWAVLPCERPFAIKGRRTGLPASVPEISLSAEEAAIPAQDPSLTGRGH